MKELRELIRDLRDDHDLKQKTVAAHLGISQQTYSNYENGRREILRITESVNPAVLVLNCFIIPISLLFRYFFHFVAPPNGIL